MKAFEKEAKERWGHTQAYKEYEEKRDSNRRHNDLAEGMDHIMAAFALCMRKGESPDSTEAQNLVKMLQSYITEHYYRCTNEILAGLGQMYVADKRFQNNIDKHGDGTASFVSDAMKVYCHIVDHKESRSN